MINADADERIGQIKSEYKNKISAKEDEWRVARSEGMRTDDPAAMAKADEIEKELTKLEEEQAEKIKKENVARDASIADIDESTKARLELTVQEREEAERRKEMLGSSGGASRYGATPVKGGRGNINPPLVGAAPASGGSGKVSGNVAEFVKKHGPLADKLASELNVPADAILGQWGLETGWGKSVIPGTNNLGNIKDFSGAGPKATDNMTGSVDSYRAYGTFDAFGDDFANLLRKRRYEGALGTTNARDYFAGLKSGGYAEDANYVNSGVRAAAMAARARNAAADVGTAQLPAQLASSSQGNPAHGFRISADPITVHVVGKDGMPTQAPQTIQLRVPAPSPFGLKMN